MSTYEFIFIYYGDPEDWDTAKTSEIFIAYAWDENTHEGGSVGNGGVTWYKLTLKNRLIKVFESEFISKVDKELGVAHKEQ